jgi:hypothetical protein
MAPTARRDGHHIPKGLSWWIQSRCRWSFLSLTHSLSRSISLDRSLFVLEHSVSSLSLSLFLSRRLARCFFFDFLLSPAVLVWLKFNCAESVNFATWDWIPWFFESTNDYRDVPRSSGTRGPLPVVVLARTLTSDAWSHTDTPHIFNASQQFSSRLLTLLNASYHLVHPSPLRALLVLSPEEYLISAARATLQGDYTDPKTVSMYVCLRCCPSQRLGGLWLARSLC